MTDTIDASGLDAHEAEVVQRPNPMTGLFFIEGAEPGDTLAVRIDRLTPSRATGWTYSPLALTVLDPAAISDRPASVRSVWIVDGDAGTVRLREPPEGLETFAPPLAPIIGRHQRRHAAAKLLRYKAGLEHVHVDWKYPACRM